MKSEGVILRIIDGKNFGFIQIGRKEYFFHRDDVVNANFNTLMRGMKVTCEIQLDNPKGPRVNSVTLV
jgi:cold shock CspA family protein